MNRFKTQLLTTGFGFLVGSLGYSGPFVGECHAQTTSTASVTPSDQYFVEFKGQGLPKDLSVRIAALGGTIVDSYPEMQVAIIGGMTADAAAMLASQADVADVTADEYVQTPKLFRLKGLSVPRSTLSPLSVSPPETAAFFLYEWNMRVIGADQAWDAGFLGSPDVRLAILDSGIDPTHPDLAGLIDTTRSTSFCQEDEKDNFILTNAFPGYPLWTDLDGHGTWVASIAASQAHYVAGVTFHTTVMAVKVGCFTSLSTSNIFRGIHFAANNGADVINISFGGAPSPKAGVKGIWHYFHRAVQYALVKGVSVVVVSAGNSAIDLDHDGNGFAVFCDVPGVICVSATGPTSSGSAGLGPFVDVDASAFYTNFGSSAIDVAAPGGNLSFDASGNITGFSVVWGACASTDRDIVNGVIVKGFCSDGGFTVLGGLGTSASAPHVSGLAALLVAQLGHGKSAQVRATIENSADDRGKPGADPFYGRGRINVARALGIP